MNYGLIVTLNNDVACKTSETRDEHASATFDRYLANNYRGAYVRASEVTDDANLAHVVVTCADPETRRDLRTAIMDENAFYLCLEAWNLEDPGPRFVSF